MHRRPLDTVPDDSIVFASDRPGAALLEGWSDGEPWRLLLPWPEELVELPWDRAGEWPERFRELEREVAIDTSSDDDAPFLGGWVGFIAYEAAATIEAVTPRDVVTPEPAMFFARHRAGIAIDPRGRAFLFGDPPEPLPENTLVTHPRFAGDARQMAPHDSLADGAHRERVERIREAILDGDVYQVNLTRAFSVAGAADPAELYRTLTGARPPRSSAFVVGNGWRIASASPEVLLRFDRVTGIAETRPIKGTMRRDGNDGEEIAALLASEKDAAEHLMIVDVARNDLGKIAPPGNVTVAEFRGVRSLDYVHHLESTVRATGLADRDAADILAALSPAASITGAPKRAAVQMIRDLEPVPRGVYCGAIGFIGARRVELSVAIRTAVATAEGTRYHAGGGIVWDSDADAEDDESRVKAAAFLRYAGAL